MAPMCCKVSNGLNTDENPIHVLFDACSCSRTKKNAQGYGQPRTGAFVCKVSFKAVTDFPKYRFSGIVPLYLASTPQNTRSQTRYLALVLHFLAAVCQTVQHVKKGFWVEFDSGRIHNR